MNDLMKKLLIPTLFLLLTSAIASAQPPPPGEHGSPDNQPAPIGGGLVLLVLMAGAYGARKVYQMRRRMNE